MRSDEMVSAGRSWSKQSFISKWQLVCIADMDAEKESVKALNPWWPLFATASPQTLLRRCRTRNCCESSNFQVKWYPRASKSLATTSAAGSLTWHGLEVTHIDIYGYIEDNTMFYVLCTANFSCRVNKMVQSNLGTSMAGRCIDPSFFLVRMQAPRTFS